MSLIDLLIQEGWLKTDPIKNAFQKIKREDFLPEDMKNLAEVNEALPIGYEQTISQPLVVAFMLEQLQPKPGEKILDVGSGSGWTAALLAHIVSGEAPNSKLKTQNSKLGGKVFALEIVPELKEFGEKNVAKYNFIEKGIVEFICADGSKGYPDFASCPELAEGFDKILASASASEIPAAWKEQLKVGGKIVAPVGSSIRVILKKSERPAPYRTEGSGAGEFEEVDYSGFVFVPLIQK